jgi:hypothetical protein
MPATFYALVCTALAGSGMDEAIDTKQGTFSHFEISTNIDVYEPKHGKKISRPWEKAVSYQNLVRQKSEHYPTNLARDSCAKRCRHRSPVKHSVAGRRRAR